MGKALEDFKQFVRLHPELNERVLKKENTWQELFETLDMTGEQGLNIKEGSSSKIEGNESFKEIMNLVRRVNPDSLTKALNTASKFLTVFQGFNANKAQSQNTYKQDPLFGKFSDFD